MEIITKSADISNLISNQKSKGRTIGFIPTMGALHQGHLSLIEYSVKAGNYTVVSIYVNPAQFNDKNDFMRYPRNLKKDLQTIGNLNCDVVFAPDDNEIYPTADNRVFDFGYLDKIMEGHFRPGHFNGVARVVSRLFDIIMPDVAYFGEKDFQQIAIVKKMVEILQYPVKIESCPIIRESDGLAMSSRNVLLTPQMRKIAPVIYQTLTQSLQLSLTEPVQKIKDFVISKIENQTGLKVEYFEIVDNETLEIIKDWNRDKNARGCIAVFAGEIRLIDNILFNFEKTKK